MACDAVKNLVLGHRGEAAEKSEKKGRYEPAFLKSAEPII
jgi:hypothetical protein